MDFDYLEVIKIQKKPPAPRCEEKNREELIKRLRSQNTFITAQEESAPHAPQIEEPKEIPLSQPPREEKTPPVESPVKAKAKREKKLGNHIMLKYLVKELFLYFLLCFAACFVVFFVNQILLLAQTILSQRVPVPSVLRLIVYSLPGIVAQSAPFATLVGFLMCLGRMATDNEILILRASGQHYAKILVPVIAMGVVISLFSFVMNDYFLPLGILHFNRLKKQIAQSDPAVEVEPQSVKYMNGTALVIGNVDYDSNLISDMVLFDTDKEGKERIIITGNSRVLKSQEEGVLMQFDMGESTVFILDGQNRRNFDVLDSEQILLNVFDSILDPASTTLAPREMTSYDLWKRIQKMKRDATVTKRRQNQFNLEFNKKFSMPFGSIFFALLAFPLSLVFGRKDGQTLGLIFGIIIAVLYWAATILGQRFGVRSGWNGFWMMWGPNFFLGLLGILLYLRLRKK